MLHHKNTKSPICHGYVTDGVECVLCSCDDRLLYKSAAAVHHAIMALEPILLLRKIRTFRSEPESIAITPNIDFIRTSAVRSGDGGWW